METYIFIADYDMEENYYMIGIIMANVEMWWHANMIYISIRNDKSKGYSFALDLCLGKATKGNLDLNLQKSWKEATSALFWPQTITVGPAVLPVDFYFCV